jgi:hypothetical protein
LFRLNGFRRLNGLRHALRLPSGLRLGCALRRRLRTRAVVQIGYGVITVLNLLRLAGCQQKGGHHGKNRYLFHGALSSSESTSASMVFSQAS